uniref:Uncharacterized protein n=1 Tax=Arundo donax TaxID=35708 RepID=A0A0A9B133_ARUDO
MIGWSAAYDLWRGGERGMEVPVRRAARTGGRDG